MSKAGVGTFVTEDHELASSGLAVFDLPFVDTSLVNGKFVTIYPRTVLSDAGPHEFTIPSDGQDFTDLPYTRLEGCLEILKLDGTKLTDTEVNAYVNLLPQSLFKQIELYINNTQISDISILFILGWYKKYFLHFIPLISSRFYILFISSLCWSICLSFCSFLYMGVFSTIFTWFNL